MLKKIVNLLIVFSLISFIACKEAVLRDLSEQKANQALLSLAEGGVRASKFREGEKWSIRVEKKNFSKALKVLKKYRFFNKGQKNQSKISSSFIPSKLEQTLEIESIKTSRLETTIKSFSSVLEVHVHLNLQNNEQSYFKDESKINQNSASVFIVSDNSNKLEILKIKRIVAGASGLEPEKVTVVIEEELAESKEVNEDLNLNLNLNLNSETNSKLKFIEENLAYISFGALFVFLLLVLMTKIIKKISSKPKAKKIVKNLNNQEKKKVKLEEVPLEPKDLGFGCRVKRKSHKKNNLVMQ